MEELLIRYFQKELSEEELLDLKVWLNANPDHKKQLSELEQMSNICAHAYLLEPDYIDAGWKKMDSIIKKESRTPGSVSLNQTLTLCLKYACIIVIAFVAGWLMQHSKKTVVPLSLPVAYNELYVNRGGRANTILLSDGSKIILNAGSSIKYPTAFNDDNRTVYLDGEAYFDVEIGRAHV